MKLPGAETAVVAENKVRGYLLSSIHLEGRSKARFFISFGFKEMDWQILVRALQTHAIQNEAHLSKRNDYGTFYNVDGPLLSSDGRNPLLRSVWVVEKEVAPPRLVTAHPI